LLSLQYAATFTHITYPCKPVDVAMGCESFEKAVMHPKDLFDNKQNSLVYFFQTFGITSLVSFGILSVLCVFKKKSTNQAN
jgi:hypothetical protein